MRKSYTTLLVALALLALGYVASRVVSWPLLPAAVELGPTDDEPAGSRDALHCRIVQLQPAQRRAELETDAWLQERLRGRTALVPERVYRNPLVANSHLVQIEIENVSGQVYSVYRADPLYHWTETR